MKNISKSLVEIMIKAVLVIAIFTAGFFVGTHSTMQVNVTVVKKNVD